MLEAISAEAAIRLAPQTEAMRAQKSVRQSNTLWQRESSQRHAIVIPKHAAEQGVRRGFHFWTGSGNQPGTAQQAVATRIKAPTNQHTANKLQLLCAKRDAKTVSAFCQQQLGCWMPMRGECSNRELT